MVQSLSRRCHCPPFPSLAIIVLLSASALPACATPQSSGGDAASARPEAVEVRPAPAPSARSGNPAGVDSPTKPADPSGEAVAERQADSGVPAVQPADPLLARGAALFKEQCVICHGENGDGAGKFAYLMNPRPRDFRKGDFKIATTENQVPSEADLIRTLTRGMPGSAMPPWGHLPKSDLQALVRFIRQTHIEATKANLQKVVAAGQMTAEQAEEALAARTQPSRALVVPPEPEFSDLRWFRGRRVYLEACASCHGKDGNPVPEAVKFDSEGYPVPPRSFVNGIFKGGSEGYQLYARILKGIRGTPMPAYEGVYSDDELWDLIHYTQSLARVGAQERAQLRQGTFVAPRVAGELPGDPLDAAWEKARPLYVAMTPLWWTENRIEGLTVQALNNGKELALRLAWIDPTVDDRAVRHDEFRDGVAVQFSLSTDPPFYMGTAGKNGGVNIWFWKADRQKNLASGYQDVDAAFPNRAVDRYPEQDFKFEDMTVVEPPRLPITKHDPTYVTAWGAGNLVADPTLKTSVESLVAQGPGTLAGKPANLQFVQGKAVYERGVWYVQMQRTMEVPRGDDPVDERCFMPGDYLPVSFAIWNGDAGDRDGKKNISIWQKLVIE